MKLKVEQELRYGILGLFTEDLEVLLTGKIPRALKTHRDTLNYRVHTFPSEEQRKLVVMIHTSYVQEKYLRAKYTVDALSDPVPQREEEIRSFIQSYK